ncbi:g5532 [Coccomyxa elongata]
MGRQTNHGWRVARAIFVLGCATLAGSASAAEAHNQRHLQQTDQGLPQINPNTIGANILLGIADNLKNFLNAATGAQDTAAKNSTDATNYLSGLEQPGGVDQMASLSAQAPGEAPAPAPARTSALLTGAPVAAPSVHLATLKVAKAVAEAPTKAPAKGEATTEGIIVIGNYPGWRPGPAPAPGPLPWDQPDLGDILRKLNLTTAHPSVLPHKLPFVPSLPPHTLPYKPPKLPPLFPPSPSAADEGKVFQHSSTTRKNAFSAADVKSFFAHTLAPEAALPLAEAPAKSEPAAAARAPEGARAPAERSSKAATTAPTLQRRRLLLDDTVSPRPPTPDQLAAQAAAVRADFANYEKKLQVSGVPERTGHVLPPDHAANATTFPGAMAPGAPLPGPPATAGQRGNPVEIVPVPVVAPAPSPGSDAGQSAPFPGIVASPPGVPAVTDTAPVPAPVPAPAQKQ